MSIKNNVVALQPDWPAPANVRAYSTTRGGGLSPAPFDSLNLAGHVGDNADTVQQNRELLGDSLGWPGNPLWLDQRHGCDIVRSDTQTVSAIADAAWTDSVASVCVVMTADCLPLLLCTTDGARIAAVHAGWRGLAAGIIERAVATLGADGSAIMAWLGPAIGPDVYEIDAVVRSEMLQSDPAATAAFAATRAGHWNMDIYQLARRRLRRGGVNEIYGGSLCTYSDPARFFSYRRDGDCGRMASMIWLEP